jgi:hypothetical protein
VGLRNTGKGWALGPSIFAEDHLSTREHPLKQSTTNDDPASRLAVEHHVSVTLNFQSLYDLHMAEHKARGRIER